MNISNEFYMVHIYGLGATSHFGSLRPHLHIRISADVDWSHLHIHHAPIFKDILLYTGFSSLSSVIIAWKICF